MGLKVVNVHGYQIETVLFCDRVIGFKVHSRYFSPVFKRQLNHTVLKEFEYFVDAARYVASQLYIDETKQQIVANTLCEVYTEGDDFHF